MATSKTAKKAASNKPVAKPAKSASINKTTVVTRTVASSDRNKKKRLDTKLPNNTINIVLVEAIGTFILTLVALFAAASATLPLYVGLTLVLAVLVIGNVSGAHINPAVTFGLWSAKKLKTVLVPFYWAAQLLGAIAAVVLLNTISNGAFAIHFDNFTEFSAGIFTVELIGTAIFLFGLTAVISRSDLMPGAKAAGIGLSLAVALFATSSLMPHVQRAAFAEFQEKQQASSEEEQKKADNERTYPREVYVNGTTLNPAVALAATEMTDSQMQGGSASAETEKSLSRFNLETILATLVGAALGANLYLLVSYRARTEDQ